MPTPEYPSVPEGYLDDWTLTAETVETVFQLPGARVVGATRQYEDERTQTAVREATGGDIDHDFRFFSATRLGFDPMLPAGTLPSLLLPTVRSEACKTFRNRLRERGVTDIDRDRTERVRVQSGNRARLTRFDGTDPVVDAGLAVTGWVGVWNDGTDFFVATGGYPAVRLTDALGVDDALLARTPADARDELLDLIRNVS